MDDADTSSRDTKTTVIKVQKIKNSSQKNIFEVEKPMLNFDRMKTEGDRSSLRTNTDLGEPHKVIITDIDTKGNSPTYFK